MDMLDPRSFFLSRAAALANGGHPIILAAGSRVSINVGSDIGETYDVSTLVNSSAPVVVERSVYWNSKIEGTCSTGYQAW